MGQPWRGYLYSRGVNAGITVEWTKDKQNFSGGVTGTIVEWTKDKRDSCRVDTGTALE